MLRFLPSAHLIQSSWFSVTLIHCLNLKYLYCFSSVRQFQSPRIYLMLVHYRNLECLDLPFTSVRQFQSPRIYLMLVHYRNLECLDLPFTSVRQFQSPRIYLMLVHYRNLEYLDLPFTSVRQFQSLWCSVMLFYCHSECLNSILLSSSLYIHDDILL